MPYFWYEVRKWSMRLIAALLIIPALVVWAPGVINTVAEQNSALSRGAIVWAVDNFLDPEEKRAAKVWLWAGAKAEDAKKLALRHGVSNPQKRERIEAILHLLTQWERLVIELAVLLGFAWLIVRVCRRRNRDRLVPHEKPTFDP